jgi:hypothetical protein
MRMAIIGLTTPAIMGPTIIGVPVFMSIMEGRTNSTIVESSGVMATKLTGARAGCTRPCMAEAYTGANCYCRR